MKKEILGPAFPLASEELSDRYDEGIDLHTGITIRDYFAAKAMQGWLANKYCNGTNGDIAKGAYDLADAMMIARELPTASGIEADTK